MSFSQTEASIHRAQYLAHNGEDLLSQVQKIICLYTPFSIVTAGYHPSGEVLMINSSSHKGKAWDIHFYEEEMINDVLWGTPDLVTGVFVWADKSMLVPENLFNTDEASHWLNCTFFIEKEDTIAHKFFENQSAYCSYSFPKSLEKLIKNYADHAPIAPLSCAHFKNKVVDVLQCTIAQHGVMASLHLGNQLLWHQHFEYESTEDILYHLTAVCQQYGIEIQNYLISLSTATPLMNARQLAFKQFFSNIPQKKNSLVDIIAPEWSSTVFLFQQLYPCVL